MQDSKPTPENVPRPRSQVRTPRRLVCSICGRLQGTLRNTPYGKAHRECAERRALREKARDDAPVV